MDRGLRLRSGNPSHEWGRRRSEGFGRTSRRAGGRPGNQWPRCGGQRARAWRRRSDRSTPLPSPWPPHRRSSPQPPGPSSLPCFLVGGLPIAQRRTGEEGGEIWREHPIFSVESLTQSSHSIRGSRGAEGAYHGVWASGCSTGSRNAVPDACGVEVVQVRPR